MPPWPKDVVTHALAPNGPRPRVLCIRSFKVVAHSCPQANHRGATHPSAHGGRWLAPKVPLIGLPSKGSDFRLLPGWPVRLHRSCRGAAWEAPGCHWKLLPQIQRLPPDQTERLTSPDWRAQGSKPTGTSKYMFVKKTHPHIYECMCIIWRYIYICISKLQSHCYKYT